MNHTDAESKIKFLREELHRHNHNYYVLNSLEISDKEFDMMLKELEMLEKSFRSIMIRCPLHSGLVPTSQKDLNMLCMSAR